MTAPRHARPSRVTLLARREQAGPGVARALNITEGDPVIHWKRLRRADGAPMCIEDAYLNEVLLPGFLQSGMPTSLYEALEQRGLRPTWAEDSINADVCQRRRGRPPRGRAPAPPCCGTRGAPSTARRSSRSRAASSAPTATRSGCRSARTTRVDPRELRPPRASARAHDGRSLRSPGFAVAVAGPEADRGARALRPRRPGRFAPTLQLRRRGRSSVAQAAERGHHVAGLLADPDRVGAAEVGLDVERVLRRRGSRGRAASGRRPRTARPGRPGRPARRRTPGPRATGRPTTRGRTRRPRGSRRPAAVAWLAGLEVGEHASPRVEQRLGVHPPIVCRRW